MAQSRNQRGFGILPPLPALLDTARKNLEAGARNVITDTERGVAAARREADRLTRVGQAELEKAGLLPGGRRPAEVANAPRPASVERTTGTSRKPRSGHPAAKQGVLPPARAEPPTANWDGVMKIGREAGGQIMAGIRGATDAATLGLGDKYSAADFALRTSGMGGSFLDRYRTFSALEEAQDQYDAKHRPIARGIGGAVGTVVPIVATGGLGAAPMIGVRVASYVPKIANPVVRGLKAAGPQVAIGGAGAATSVLGQISSDLEAKKLSSPDTYAGVAAGGMVGGLTTAHVSPHAGATAQAVVTHGANSLLSGAPLSVEDMARDAVVGSTLARLGDYGGRKWSNGLPPTEQGKGGRLASKEGLGELFSKIHSLTRGERVVGRQVPRKTSGGYTRVDHVSEDIFAPKRQLDYENEAKFGYWSSPKKRQREAMAERPDRYRLDRYTPHDVGKMSGGFLGLFSSQATSREDDARNTLN